MLVVHGSALVLILASLAFTVTTSLVERTVTSSRTGRPATHRGRTSNNGQPRTEELPYYWMCPEVRCQALPDGCDLSEYIVFEYQYEVRGRGTVNVRCQSCPYCLDLPAVAERRAATKGRTREGASAAVIAAEQECPEDLQCPLLPEQCEEVRQTIVLIRGRPCKFCPACYDQTVLHRAL